MATKPQAIENESAHFNNFRKFLPAFTDRCDKTIDHLLKVGIIQVSTAFEQAIATVADCTIVNENRYDLSDGSECKMATTQYHRGQVDAQIRGITGKDGTLCVHIYEQFSKKFYYFVIPYHEYKNLKVVEIPFTFDGGPKRNNKWWNWEVNSFEELATTKYENNISIEMLDRATVPKIKNNHLNATPFTQLFTFG